MRHGLVFTLMLLISAQVLAQQAGNLELQVGTGLQLIRYSNDFAIDRSLAASAIYDVTDRSSIMFSFRHLVYTFDKEFNDNHAFVGGRPDIQRVVNIVLIGSRIISANKSKTFAQYGSLSLGIARSVPSSPGYYFSGITYDSGYAALKSGYTVACLISLGFQVAPFSFLHLFAEIEYTVPFDVDRIPGGISLRGGFGIPVFKR